MGCSLGRKSLVQWTTGLAIGIALTFTTLADAKAKTLAEYWRETPLRLKNARYLINQENCYERLKKFIGCVQAFNNLANHLHSPAQLVTQNQLKSFPEDFGEVVAEFGGLSLALVKPRPKHIKILAEKIMLQKKMELDELTQLYGQIQIERTNSVPKTLDVDIETVLKDLEARIVNSENEAELAAELINGYFRSTVDPHSRILPDQMVEDQKSAASQEFAGVGLKVQPWEDKYVVYPLEGSPAQVAGVKAKDVLTHVDGTPIKGMTEQELTIRVRGVEGSSVKLGLLRKDQPIELSIIRRTIEIKNVSSQWLETATTKIGYIKLAGFINDSCKQVKEEIETLEKHGAQTLVFDLRGNTGGILSEAICIAGLFLGPDKVVLQIRNFDRFDSVLEPEKTEEALVTNLPLITLIDEGSASASEILAGALQDHQRSWLLGVRSFGKGTAQREEYMPGLPGVMLIRTKFVFYQPSGRSNQGHGIYTDFEVYKSPNPTEDEKFALREANTYTNVVLAEPIPWVQKRPEQVASLKTCMDADYTAEKIWRENLEADSDYQLLSAQELAGCLNQKNLAARQ